MQTIKSDALLFQPDSVTPMVLSQLIVESGFRGIQAPELAFFRLCLEAPQRSMLQQSLPIHEKRCGVAEEAAQLIENGKAMRV
jgi:hypothetical protein